MGVLDAGATPLSDVGVEEKFLQIVCTDDLLLDAEFDAIISAEWPVPPEVVPGRGPGRRWPAASSPSPVRYRMPRLRARPVIRCWVRERSPPRP